MILPILHFNDVYRVSKQKLQSGKTIDVTQFAQLVDDRRKTWPSETGGLLLFSGDLFSPSVESSVTRGSHMVPVINQIAPDIALTGNHDFDFGYPHLYKLMADCKFPWILSNIVDTRTGNVPKGLQQFCVFERGDTRIGVIGLVEKNWITTVPAWPQEFVYSDMIEIGMGLSEKLRDQNGDYRCDIILALTHSRLPNDIALAKALHADVTTKGVESKHGVDMLFGGHDHTYYIGKGMDSWDNYAHISNEPGTEADNGVRLVKSGTDFRDLSEIVLELVDTPPGSVRRKIIQSLHGKRHQTHPDMQSSKPMSELLATLLSDVSLSLSTPVCITLEEWDVRSEIVRTDESAFGNWMADVVRHTYDDSIENKGDHSGGADGVLLCGGALRGDSRYGPGEITIGDILEILPFSDAIVVIEMDGHSLWDLFESSLSMWPAQEGRFPVISGFRVEWDSRKLPGNRVLGIWLTADAKKALKTDNFSEAIKGDEVKPILGGKQYKVVTRQYMYEGHDGCEALVGKHCLVDDESGVIMSSIVRKFLLGSQYIHQLKQLSPAIIESHPHIATDTKDALLRAHEQWKQNAPPSDAGLRWVKATNNVLHKSQEHCKRTIADALRISHKEHMSEVDRFDGSQARKGGSGVVPDKESEYDLITVRPVRDGRLKDVARAPE